MNDIILPITLPSGQTVNIKIPAVRELKEAGFNYNDMIIGKCKKCGHNITIADLIDENLVYENTVQQMFVDIIYGKPFTYSIFNNQMPDDWIRQRQEVEKIVHGKILDHPFDEGKEYTINYNDSVFTITNNRDSEKYIASEDEVKSIIRSCIKRKSTK